MDAVGYSLQYIDHGTFEHISTAFLAHEEHDIHPSGTRGTDGGWDGLLRIDDGVAAYSTKEEWRPKLRSDAARAEDLKDELDADFELFIYVTNEEVTGKQELELKSEIEEEHGWSLQIYHAGDLRRFLTLDRPDLGDQYLRVPLDDSQSQWKRINEFVDQRLSCIADRRGPYDNLRDGPTVAVHLVPNRFDRRPYERDPNDLPTMYPFGNVQYRNGPPRNGVSGKLRWAVGRPGEDPRWDLSVLSRSGWYEAVSTEMFSVDDNGNHWINNKTRFPDHLDTQVAGTFARGLATLKELDATTPIFAAVSLLDAGKCHMKVTKTHTTDYVDPFPSDKYKTGLEVIESTDVDPADAARPHLNEIMREAGNSPGSENYSDDEWVGEQILGRSNTV